MAAVRNAFLVASLALIAPHLAAAAPPREFGAGHPFVVSDLPPGRFRDRLEALPAQARQRALDKLHEFSFPAEDVQSLHADDDGGIFYVCNDGATAPTSPSDPFPAGAAIPVSPFPDSLKFHSRPGCTNVLVLDFDGFTVSGTAWNSSLGRDPVPAVAFSTDADFTTFSDAEQVAIKRIWQRVAEDYAPFNIDVTTEEPAALTPRVARALVTRSTDANGAANPSSSAGGVAYVGVFGQSNYSTYSPAWIYFNNLGYAEYNISEACSHEIGHNMGLSHDGKTDGTEYYAGHGSGNTAWAPIMGVSYGKNVSQWSKGEYYLANNLQDDLSIIAGKLAYRVDDHAGAAALATVLQISGGSNVVATTPETDPANANTANKGVIERGIDTDVVAFATGAGAINLTVQPWVSPANSRGGNLDIVARLVDAGGNQIVRVDPTDQTYAVVSATVTAGVYYLYISDTGTGDPLSPTPGGYTAYASLGQFFITGRVVAGSDMIFPPQATLSNADDVVSAGGTNELIVVTYSDNAGIDTSTLGDDDLRVTGPNGYDAAARLVSVNNAVNGTPRVATYAIDAPGGTWSAGDNGTYTILAQAGAVKDIEGASVPAGSLGIFACGIQNTIYAADMNQSPGWTLDAAWAYGKPAGANGDPASGFTGSNVVGNALNGVYPRTLATAYATTPAINCSLLTTVTLRFQRWLGVRSGDTALIDVSSDGVNWTRVWTSSGILADASWTSLMYDVSSVATGKSTVFIRWGLSANGDNRVSFGWNLDDVEVLGTGGAPTFTLTASASPANRGSVSPTSGLFSAGTPVTVTPTAAQYFRFNHWTGDLTGNLQPGVVVMSADRNVQAVFAEIVTTNHATPYWWLAANGWTNNFEAAESAVGDNGLQLWESFVAGLDPHNAGDVFEVTNHASGLSSGGFVVQWPAMTGHVYSVCWTPNLATGFQELPGATNIVWPQESFTDTLHGANAEGVYQVRVRLP